VGRTVVADAVTGIWSTDFDDPGDGDLTFDLVPGTNGYTGRYDADNDATNADWHVLNPSFTVDPLTNGAWGGDFTPTATITLSRGADSCTTISDVWGNFGFDLNSCPTPIDLNAGDAVSVTDGATTKTHTITNLTVTAVVEATNTVTGTADANSDVHVWTHNDGSSLIVTADVSGVWTADFTGLFTFAPGTNGSAHQYDVDNDATNADWRIPKPQVGVDIGRNDVFGNEFAPNSSVTVTVNGGTVHGPFATDDWGNFGTPPLPIDIVAGDAVVASDSFDTVTHVVLVLDVTSVDPILETVSGTAPDGTHVDVWVHDVGDVNRSVTADAAGTWTADFTAAGIVGPNDRGTADLGPGSNGNSNRCDTEGNCTYAQWQLLDPYIGASVIHEEVWANGFPDDPAGQTLYYRLDDPATPGIDFEYDMPLILNPWGGTEAGDRSFGRYDVQAGQVFTVRNRPFDQPLNGGLERVLHISDIEVTGVDGGADIITGYADPAQGPTVCVWSQDSQLCSDEAAGFTWVGTDWIADFGAIGSDVKPGHWNSASQYDDDGDETHYWWNLPPWVVVELAEEDAAGDPLWPDAVRAEQWNGPVVTLTVNDEVVATWTVDSDWYRFELAGRDLDPSDVVTLSDAQDSKSVVVEPLTIEQVYFSGDTPPNAVAGTSSSQRDVHVVAAASVGGWWAERWVNADSGGDWFADFDNPGNGWREQWTAEFGGAEGLGRQLLLETYDEDNDRVEATQCEGVPRLVVARSDGRVD
ncbi:MAG: hypothetical protein OEO77_15895, partial [Acidimicrobiia bacterium]|nr:hypothetical protein [Acidimicrobiia bacterium]